MDSWYAMNDEHGKPQGYAHLEIRRGDDQVTEVSWQLRLAFVDGSYEEDRSMALNGRMTLLRASYSSGQMSCKGTRTGGDLQISTSDPTKPGTHESLVSAPVDALPGLDFALVSALPLKEGFTLTYTAVNEADGFKSLGPAKLEVKGKETIRWLDSQIEVWKIERESKQRERIVRLPVWVDTQGCIIQVDWGGGNLMVLSRTPTTHLFSPSKK